MFDELEKRFNEDAYSLNQEERLLMASIVSSREGGKLPNAWALYLCPDLDPSFSPFKKYDSSKTHDIIFDLPSRYQHV